MTEIFSSERIRFTEVSELLIPDYLRMVNDYENVNIYLGSAQDSYTEEDEVRWVREKLETDAPVFSMTEKETGDFIGNIELMDVHDTVAELGTAITAHQQNLGCGTEAIEAIVRHGCEQLGLTRIFLKVYPQNVRAIHVYSKCGFRAYDRTEHDIFMERNLTINGPVSW